MYADISCRGGPVQHIGGEAGRRRPVDDGKAQPIAICIGRGDGVAVHRARTNLAGRSAGDDRRRVAKHGNSKLVVLSGDPSPLITDLNADGESALNGVVERPTDAAGGRDGHALRAGHQTPDQVVAVGVVG